MSELAYLNTLRNILDHGDDFMDRTGTGCRGMFGGQLRFDMRDGFPLFTTKKLHVKGIIAELLWFLSGSTNNNDLKALGANIWDEWADKDTGDLGPIYGEQWRRQVGVRRTGPDAGYTQITDQIAVLIELIKRDPYSRRQVVSAWDVAKLPDMALAPCHALFQTKVTTDGRLHLQLYQRSADMFLGVPYNIASYSLLLHMLADQTGHEPGEFIWTVGDAHIYSNHVDQVREQLSRPPRPLPTLGMLSAPTINDYTVDHFALANYDPHPAIKAPVAV